ncbi:MULTISPECIES: hypothetical protein [Streptomyces]|uniref:hypothetical protein n=1 Tax=Streptomyces TaxID=1883 RepID=UPI001E289BDC|nr:MULTISPECIES: hypothetical protein [Streptomyces]UFQ18213.1 hypothetical protein J2N69_26225 [Streptomyces huasconensis]WCL87825.1 hypothetical protein PPN52_26220 [Streptomyces sp. JCM 35825]
MGTETEDAAGAKDATGIKDADGTKDAEAAGEVTVGAKESAPGAEAGTVDVTKSGDSADDVDGTEEADEADEGAADEALAVAAARPAKAAGVGQGAAAVVSAALGVIGLSGGWLGTVAAARSNIMGQLETARSASVGRQIQSLYGDSWKVTALIAGLFALTALVTGFVVLVRPAFGAPGQEQAPWIKSVAWAGVVLGVIGLILAVLKYSDLLLGLPSTPS